MFGNFYAETSNTFRYLFLLGIVLKLSDKMTVSAGRVKICPILTDCCTVLSHYYKMYLSLSNVFMLFYLADSAACLPGGKETAYIGLTRINISS